MDERRDTQKHVDKIILRQGFFAGFTRVMETPTDEDEKSEVDNVGGSLALLKTLGLPCWPPSVGLKDADCRGSRGQYATAGV
jgi:hypothetical protein